MLIGGDRIAEAAHPPMRLPSMSCGIVEADEFGSAATEYLHAGARQLPLANQPVFEGSFGECAVRWSVEPI